VIKVQVEYTSSLVVSFGWQLLFVVGANVRNLGDAYNMTPLLRIQLTSKYSNDHFVIRNGTQLRVRLESAEQLVDIGKSYNCLTMIRSTQYDD